MKTALKDTKFIYVDRHDPELDNLVMLPSKKLEKAKAYFEKNGVPDFDKILREAQEKKKDK